MQTSEQNQTCAATPGPWTYKDSTVNNGYRVYRFEQMSGCVQRWAGDERGDADARLMLAAPDLLESCQDLLAVVEAYYRTLPDDGPEQDNIMTSYIEPAKRAIAKATH